MWCPICAISLNETATHQSAGVVFKCGTKLLDEDRREVGEFCTDYGDLPRSERRIRSLALDLCRTIDRMGHGENADPALRKAMVFYGPLYYKLRAAIEEDTARRIQAVNRRGLALPKQ
jgi:hypothetical protein